MWTSPRPHAHAPALAQMQRGDQVALKRGRVKDRDAPFFNADAPVSSITVLAMGTVREVDGDEGTVGVV